MRSDLGHREHRVDAFVERYVEWLDECDALETAYRHWTVSKGPERDRAFAIYSAALDREERAAWIYGVVAERERARECA